MMDLAKLFSVADCIGYSSVAEINKQTNKCHDQKLLERNFFFFWLTIHVHYGL